MKSKFAYLISFVLAVLVAVVAGIQHGATAALWSACIGTAGVNYLFAGNKVFAGQCNVTLIQNILSGVIFPAFRTKVPELAFFSVDLGKSGSQMPAPVKYGQEVISQMMVAPTAASFTPGDDPTTGAVAVDTLAVDVKVKMDQAAIVNIKLTAASAAVLMGDGVFMKSLEEAGISLGRKVVADVIAQVTQKNFSHELLTTIAGTDYDVLEDAATQLNAQAAATPRYCLGGSSFMQAVGADARTASGDYHGQRTGDDPYRSFTGIAGFREVREFPSMPSGTSTLGTFTVVAATNVITVSANHGLAVGDRIRVTSATTLPAGMAVNTDYYVLTVPSTTTLTVSASIGGAVLDITDTGTGAHTIKKFNALNAFAFAQNSIHIAIRPLFSNDDLAAQLGIPRSFKRENVIDPETGLAFTTWLYQEPKTGDLYAAVIVFYGIRAGRALTGATNPAAEAADSAFDRAGLRIVESASTLA